MIDKRTLSSAIWMLSLVALGACSLPDSASSDATGQREGREETQNIRNTQSIGYSGNSIADKLDGALDANDQRNQQIQDADQY